MLIPGHTKQAYPGSWLWFFRYPKAKRQTLSARKAALQSSSMEFIKVGESEVLKRREEQQKQKNNLMKDVIEAIGIEIVDQPEWKTKGSTIKQLTMSYAHPSVDDDDDF